MVKNEDIWDCDYCNKSFTIKKECAKHEKSCKYSVKKTYEKEVAPISKKTFLIILTIFIILFFIIVGIILFNLGIVTGNPQQSCWNICHTVGNEMCFYDNYLCSWRHYPDWNKFPPESYHQVRFMI